MTTKAKRDARSVVVTTKLDAAGYSHNTFDSYMLRFNHAGYKAGHRFDFTGVDDGEITMEPDRPLIAGQDASVSLSFTYDQFVSLFGTADVAQVYRFQMGKAISDARRLIHAATPPAFVQLNGKERPRG